MIINRILAKLNYFAEKYSTPTLMTFERADEGYCDLFYEVFNQSISTWNVNDIYPVVDFSSRSFRLFFHNIHNV